MTTLPYLRGGNTAEVEQGNQLFATGFICRPQWRDTVTQCPVLWPPVHEGRWKWSEEYHEKYRSLGDSLLHSLHNGFSDLKPQTHGSRSSGWGAWIVWTAIISIARCFLDWPWNPFVCPRFIIGRAKWLAPCLSFITAVPQISRQTAGEFSSQRPDGCGPHSSRESFVCPW